MMKNQTKKIVTLSLLLAISIVLSIIESMISLDNFFVPGVKIGLANVITLLVIYKYKTKDSLIVLILRILLVGFLRGTFLQVPFYMSLCGGILSFIFLVITKKLNIFTIVGVSIVSSVMHVVGQIIIAIIFTSVEVIYYLPILLISSIISGLLVGFIARVLLNRVFYND